VHAEIAKERRLTSAVQKHVLDHRRDYVVLSTFEENGVMWGPGRLRAWRAGVQGAGVLH